MTTDAGELTNTLGNTATYRKLVLFNGNSKYNSEFLQNSCLISFLTQASVDVKFSGYYKYHIECHAERNIRWALRVLLEAAVRRRLESSKPPGQCSECRRC